MPRTKKPRFTRQRPPDPESLAASWRLFLALPVPADAQGLVARITERLAADEALPVRWSDPGTAHVTVQFIGEVDREQAELIRLALGPVIATHPVFRLRTADLGVFPTIRRPRVLWLGLHGPLHRLAALRDDVTRTLAEIEAPHDTDDYHPHISLGRVRNDASVRVRDIPAAVRERYDALMADGLGTMRAPVEVPVDELVLYRSILGPTGARHEVVQRYPLAARRPGISREPVTTAPAAGAPAPPAVAVARSEPAVTTRAVREAPSRPGGPRRPTRAGPAPTGRPGTTRTRP